MVSNISRYGYTRVMAASIPVVPGDIERNCENIVEAIRKATAENVDLLVLPELALTGYTCGDLFFDSLLQDKIESTIYAIAQQIPGDGPLVVLGSPFTLDDKLFNCAFVLGHRVIYGIVPKRHLPNYNEFYERRWFSEPGMVPVRKVSLKAMEGGIYTTTSFGTDILFLRNEVMFGVEICEDLWVPAPPSAGLAAAGAVVIANLSATPESIGKYSYLKNLVCQQSARCRCGYVYASAGSGESSTDLVFSGNALIAEDGTMLAEGKRFSLDGTYCIADIDTGRLRADRLRFNTFNEDRNEAAPFYIVNCGTRNVESDGIVPADKDLRRKVPASPFVPSDKANRRETCAEIIEIQAWGLAQRLRKIGCRKAVVGISGGLDSTLALLVTAKTFRLLGLDPKGIIGITMPGFGTTTRTRTNAHDLMEELGVTVLEIPIGASVEQHFKDIDQNPSVHDATYENSQARERTQILMDMANKENAIVIGTGDLSELALGWCTYNGDHMSMYAVNASIPKTLVSYLIETFAIEAQERGDNRIAETLRDIIDTPISPELIPANEDGTISQKTEDLVGPYELHDFFLFHLLRNRFEPAKIFMLSRKAFAGKYDDKVILRWLETFYRRFFSQQFKRSCLPDGPKVGSVCLSPRGDWRMPSDISSRMWLKEIEKLKEEISCRETKGVSSEGDKNVKSHANECRKNS